MIERHASTKMFTIDEVADLLAVSTKTVSRLIKAGAIRKHQIGRGVRISQADLQTYVAINRQP